MAETDDAAPDVRLPAAKKTGGAGGMSLEEALAKRRSVRSFQKVSLTLAEISQLLWAAQGTTASGGYRSAPSAGGKVSTVCHNCETKRDCIVFTRCHGTYVRSHDAPVQTANSTRLKCTW